eukprot:3999062-Prymnesium_polylepis.1
MLHGTLTQLHTQSSIAQKLYAWMEAGPRKPDGVILSDRFLSMPSTARGTACAGRFILVLLHRLRLKKLDVPCDGVRHDMCDPPVEHRAMPELRPQLIAKLEEVEGARALQLAPQVVSRWRPRPARADNHLGGLIMRVVLQPTTGEDAPPRSSASVRRGSSTSMWWSGVKSYDASSQATKSSLPPLSAKSRALQVSTTRSPSKRAAWREAP